MATNDKSNLNQFERYTSLGVGPALVALGIAQRSPVRGLLIAGLGMAVTYRGVTGHCYVYEALGIDTSKTAFPQDSTLIAINDEGAPSARGHARNLIDRERFEKLKDSQVDRGRDENEAIEIAAVEIKELRRREGRSKNDAFDADQFDETKDRR